MLDLVIPLKIWQEILYCTKLCDPNEVTGIGILRLKRVDKETLKVERLFLPEQKVSRGLSTFDETALHGIIVDLADEGKGDDIEWLRFRWHSHGRGDVYFSTIDEEDIDNWAGDWVINLVVNVYGEHVARLDMFEPLRIRQYPVRVIIDYPVNRRLMDRCKDEVDAKVRD
ncbi:Mov34/MPN/PAD-1 family protein [Candidatus Saccharibacteria bacterium]|nr:Mov34/MPN/PAD-1 family protein [Candidatus Saccharibacteria bacterium]